MSGVGDGQLQVGMSSLLCFLSAAAERYDYERRTDSAHPDGDEDPFPRAVMRWAWVNHDEITMLQLEIEETEGLIEEDLHEPDSKP